MRRYEAGLLNYYFDVQRDISKTIVNRAVWLPPPHAGRIEPHKMVLAVGALTT